MDGVATLAWHPLCLLRHNINANRLLFADWMPHLFAFLSVTFQLVLDAAFLNSLAFLIGHFSLHILL